MVALLVLTLCCPLRVTVLVAGLASVRAADRVSVLVAGLASVRAADRVLVRVTGLVSVRVADRVSVLVAGLASVRTVVDLLETEVPCPCLVSLLLLTAVEVLALVAGLVLA